MVVISVHVMSSRKIYVSYVYFHIIITSTQEAVLIVGFKEDAIMLRRRVNETRSMPMEVVVVVLVNIHCMLGNALYSRYLLQGEWQG